MLNELKKFIEEQLKKANKYAKTPDDVYCWRGIAFGALLFAQDNKLIEGDCEWWEDYWCQFQDVVDKIVKKRERE